MTHAVAQPSCALLLDPPLPTSLSASLLPLNLPFPASRPSPLPPPNLPTLPPSDYLHKVVVEGRSSFNTAVNQIMTPKSRVSRRVTQVTSHTRLGYTPTCFTHSGVTHVTGDIALPACC